VRLSSSNVTDFKLKNVPVAKPSVAPAIRMLQAGPPTPGKTSRRFTDESLPGPSDWQVEISLRAHDGDKVTCCVSYGQWPVREKLAVEVKLVNSVAANSVAFGDGAAFGCCVVVVRLRRAHVADDSSSYIQRAVGKLPVKIRHRILVRFVKE